MQRLFDSMPLTDQRKRFLLFGTVYVALWIGTWYGARVLESLGAVSLWFLPAGFRFFCMLAFGWAGVLLELAVQLVFALMQLTAIAGPPITDLWSVNTLWRLYNLLGSLIANALVTLPLRHWLHDNNKRWDFARPAHSAWFLAAALVASALSAVVGTWGIIQLGFVTPDQFRVVAPSWLIGDFIGIITLTPLLMLRVWPGLDHFLHHGRWRARYAPGRPELRDDLYTITLVVAALVIVFGIPWQLRLVPQFPLLALLLLLPLAIVAWHFGLRGAVLATILADCGLVALISVSGQREQALQYQVVMIAIALVGLWLGGAVEALNRITTRYRDFAGISNDLLWETDAAGRLTEASGRLADQFAWAPGKAWSTLLAPIAQPQLNELDRALARREAFRNIEIALTDSQGATHWIHLNGLPLIDASGEPAGYRGTAVDVSRARQAEELLQDYNAVLRREVAERTQELAQSHSEVAAKERHLQVLLAAAPVGVLEIDDGQRCRFINANGCALTGHTAEQALGLHLLDFVHPDDRDYVGFVWNSNRQSEDVQWLEFRLAQSDLRCTGHWIKLAYADQSLNGAIMVLTNATARSRHDERLWTLAHHDALTDLPNRNLFWDRLDQAIRHARRRSNGAAALLLDLDGFKAVNDRLGHAAGDALLQQVAQRLRGRIRESDTIARMGGDEFSVIMPDITENGDALQIAESLLASLSAPFELPQGEARISGSIGVALYPQHAESAESLMQCADVAMYAAKHAGKNQVRIWTMGDGPLPSSGEATDASGASTDSR